MSTLTRDRVVDAARAHFRIRFGAEADLEDTTDRELFAASVAEAAEQLMREDGTPGVAVVTWSEDGDLQLHTLRADP